jgi:hypothetical protein
MSFKLYYYPKCVCARCGVYLLLDNVEEPMAKVDKDWSMTARQGNHTMLATEIAAELGVRKGYAVKVAQIEVLLEQRVRAYFKSPTISDKKAQF